MFIRMSDYMKKKVLLFIFIFIIGFLMVFYAYPSQDWVWNYGFCLNVSKGLVMYKDFNMVITPLYPLVIGNFMKIVGNSTISYSLICSFFFTLGMMVIYKYKKNLFLPIVVLILNFFNPSYNLWCLALFLFIYFLEEGKGHDYLIGFLLGLLFLTKTSFGLIVIASLYYFKKPKKILKRIGGFLIPCVFFLIYFLITSSLYDFINQVFLGLLDFSKNNFDDKIGIFGLIIEIIVCSYLIYDFIKNKNILTLYVLLFQIMAYPIFNASHVVMALIPFIVYIIDKSKWKIDNIYIKIVLWALTITPLCGIILHIMNNEYTLGSGYLKDKYVFKDVNDLYLEIKDIEGIEKAEFVTSYTYYYKLLLGLDIEKYDLLNYGNNGYNSIKKIEDYYDSLDKGTIFIVPKVYEGGQMIEEVYNYVKSNYKYKESVESFDIYYR